MAGYVKVYIVFPSVIYGHATGELVEQGIQNPHSYMIRLAQIALERGRSGIVGAGLNIWPNVDIQERKSPTIFWIFTANMVVTKSLTSTSSFTTRLSPIQLHHMVVRAYTLGRTVKTPFSKLARQLERHLQRLGNWITLNQQCLQKKKLSSTSA
jgi:hypothetical protein